MKVIIDNKKTVIRDRKLQLLLPIFILIIISILLFSNLMINPIGGVSRHTVIVILLVIYAFTVVFTILRNYHYFSLEIDNQNIVIRYYRLKPFSLQSQNKKLEIPIQNFKKFEIIKSFLNIKQDLIVFQSKDRQLFRYPPVSISALDKKEKKILVDTLNSLKK